MSLTAHIIWLLNDNPDLGDRLQSMLAPYPEYELRTLSDTLRPDSMDTRNEAVILAVDSDERNPIGRIKELTQDTFGMPLVFLAPEGAGMQNEAFASGACEYLEDDHALDRTLLMALRHVLASKPDLDDPILEEMVRAQQMAHIGSWEMGPDKTVIWSKAMYELLDCGPEELTTFDSLRQKVHPEDRSIFDQANRATFTEGWPLDFEYRITRKNGEIRHLHLRRHTELDYQGKLVRAYGVAHDITPQKQYEQALEQRDNILRAVSQAAGVFLRDQDVATGSVGVLQALGLSLGCDACLLLANNEDAPDQPGTTVHEWRNEAAQRMESSSEKSAPLWLYKLPRWHERLSAGKSIMGHTRHFPPHEKTILAGHGIRSVLAVPVFVDANWWGTLCAQQIRHDRQWLPTEAESMGLAAEIMGNAILRDRMQQKLVTANATARRALLEAKEANKAKSRFLANMSHEIRTPISGIIGLTEMTITTGLKPEQRKNLDMIRDAAKSLLAIVNDVLDLSKIEADKMTLSTADFDFVPALERMVHPFQAQARHKGVTLEMRIDEKLPNRVHGDEDRLGQIIRNLLSNAIKFTDTGRIDIAAELGQKRKDGFSVAFSVADTGMGIPADKLNTIFDSFAQLEQPHGKLHQGTGLGLAITRELVTLMHGDIEVSSMEGRGSLFSFDVWFTPATSKADQKPDITGTLPSTMNLRLLLAEDNRLNQKFLTHFLTMFGHTVQLAENGVQALEILRSAKTPFDMVLMDVQMPEMDGLEAAKAIRNGKARNVHRNIPIIALTAYAMKGEREKILAAGIDEYVSKPVDMKKLANAISRLVQDTQKPSGRSCMLRQKRMPETRPTYPPQNRFSLDMAALTERFQGNDALLMEILELFLQESHEKLELLNKAQAQNDSEELAKALHSISNIVSHVHAMDIMAESRQLEQWASQGRMDLACSGLQGLRQRFARVVDAVRIHLEKFKN